MPGTPIIDSQIHCYESNHPERPWHGTLHGPDEMTGSAMVAFMDRVGVDAALLVSPWVMYHYDATVALTYGAQFPDRFGLIKPFDPNDPNVTEDIRSWAGMPGVVGGRLMMGAPASRKVDPGGADRIARACGELDLPLNVLCWGNLSAFGELAAKHTNTQFVIDHLGILQPFERPIPTDPFADLDAVLAQAELPNVAIKISGACTLSHEAFPFEDIWPPLLRIFEAYDISRCLWGTDWTRAVEVVDAEASVDAFKNTDRLSDDDKAALMGVSLMKIYKWHPQIGNN